MKTFRENSIGTGGFTASKQKIQRDNVTPVSIKLQRCEKRNSIGLFVRNFGALISTEFIPTF